MHPRIYPAAGLNTTADDMARLMLALLGEGRAGDVRILSESSAAEMQRLRFTMAPGLPGMAFGAGGGAGLLFGLPDAALWELRVMQVAAALGLAAAAGVLPVCRAGAWPRWVRAHYAIGAAACLVFAAWARYWNLLGR